MKIYVEWICQKCKRIHRVIFDVIADLCAQHRIERPLYTKDEISIDDPAFNRIKYGKRSTKVLAKINYAIYVSSLTPISKIISTLREYANEFYTMEKNTLKVDICLE
jgi:hypothetical protein